MINQEEIKFLTSAQAARMLEMTDSGIRRLIERGKLKAKKHGRDWIIKTDDLQGITKSTAGRPRKTG